MAPPKPITNLPSRPYRAQRSTARCRTPRAGPGTCHRHQDPRPGQAGKGSKDSADVAGQRYAKRALEAAGPHNVVMHYTNATDSRTQLRGETLRCGGPGTGPRVSVNAVPTSFESGAFSELRQYGVLRSSSNTISANFAFTEF